MSRDEPLVSVITIFLDAEQYLEEAVASVRAQSYAAWELLLVNDGSRDRSGEIARRLAAEDPARIRYLHHPDGRNHGMSASRNLGVEAARGEYIALLDADDVYLPGKLEHQVGLLERHRSAAFTYSATVHWHSWTGRPADAGRDQPRQLGVPPDTLVPPPRMIPKFLRSEAQTPGTCAMLIRRDAVVALGGFENRFPGMFDDQVLIYKLCLAAPVFVSSGRFDLYRQHQSSHLRRMLAAGEYGIMGEPNPAYGRFLEWVEQYLAAVGEDDPEVRRELRRQLAPYRSRARWWLARTTGRARWWQDVLRRKLAGRLSRR